MCEETRIMCSDFHSKYSILNKLGEGTFSDVLKCSQTSSGRLVAVKKLKKQFDRSSEALSLPELVTLVRLPEHKNVLRLLEYIFDNREGKLFMVFELMETSLYDLIVSHKRCMSELKVKHLLHQMLKGVDHLHSNGIFHRDIKPENILMRNSTLKVADLGSVRAVHSRPPYTEYVSTRWYRAPECLLTAGYYGPKMDVWACGCVFYEMLTSKPIFPGTNELDQLTRIHKVTGTPSSRVLTKIRHNQSKVTDVRFPVFPGLKMATLLPFTSDGGREVIKRMLIYDPEARTNIRRLLEHRYFDEMAANVRNIKYANSTRNVPAYLRSTRNISINRAGNVSLMSLPSLQPKMNGPDSQRAEVKLLTKSWAHSTDTTTVTKPLPSTKQKSNLTTQMRTSNESPTVKRNKPLKFDKSIIFRSDKPNIGRSNSRVFMPNETEQVEKVTALKLSTNQSNICRNESPNKRLKLVPITEKNSNKLQPLSKTTHKVSKPLLSQKRADKNLSATTIKKVVRYERQVNGPLVKPLGKERLHTITEG